MTKPIIDLNKCVCCGACITCCPAEAIEFFQYRPVISDDCAECGRCKEWCPAGAIE